MVRTPNKELDVALELFNSELKKLKSLEKEQAVIKKAERKKADAVKALQEAEKNPDLSSEEKAQAKATWLKADDDLKFEINSLKKDLAMVLIDSVAIHKEELTFSEAEDLIMSARNIIFK